MVFADFTDFWKIMKLRESNILIVDDDPMYDEAGPVDC